MTPQDQSTAGGDTKETGRVLGIVQARMGSRRLPGKVLMPLCGIPMLVMQMNRLTRCRMVDQWVVATSTNPENDSLVACLQQHGYQTFRGHETDVMARFADCIRVYGGDIIVRMTGDCPLSDPVVVDEAVSCFLAHADEVDYVAVDNQSYPRGLDCEVFRSLDLLSAHQSETRHTYREHVTPFMNQHPDIFRLRHIQNPDPRPNDRWCVDEPADFDLIQQIFEALYPQNPHFSWQDVCRFIETRPDLLVLNQSVTQIPFEKESPDIVSPDAKPDSRYDFVLGLIQAEVSRILTEKGAPQQSVSSDMRFLGGSLDFDSLDLATVVIFLEQKTGYDPFRHGFVQFTTVGELARLYDAPV